MDLNKPNGRQIGIIRDAIQEAFTPATLNELLVTQLNKPQLSFLVRDAPFSNQVFQLILRSKEEAWTDQLVAAVKQTSQNAKIRALDADLESPVSKAVAAIGIINNWKRDPQIRDLIIGSKVRLQSVVINVELFRSYKDMHDCLHRIQVTHYPPMERAVENFTSSNVDYDEIHLALDALSTEAAAFRVSVTKLPFERRAQELRKANELDQALDILSITFANADPVRFGAGLSSLRRIFRQYSVALNSRMLEVARNLPIADLIATLKSAHDFIPSGESDVARLSEAIDALQRLWHELSRDIETHGVWQELDTELWEAEAGLKRNDGDAFGNSWPILGEGVTKLCAAAPTELWSRELYTKANEVQTRFPPTMPPGQEFWEKFRIFASGARRRFFMVDGSLAIQSAELLDLKKPLDELLA